MAYNILVVDDDASDRRMVETILHDKLHYETVCVENGKQAIDILTAERDDIDLVLLDMSMPGVNGLDVLRAAKPVRPNLPIIIRTGSEDIDAAVSAIKAGAVDFVKKTDSTERLQACITNALRAHALHDELVRIKNSVGNQSTFDNIVGKSAPVQDMLTLAKRMAKSQASILLEGEDGTGKHLLAHAIHNASARSGKPFIVVDCDALPAESAEGILFGHDSHAAVDGNYKAFGKLREADGGTVFLDNVSGLRTDLQLKLLTALQENAIEPIGALAPVKIDVRVITASHVPLIQEVQTGKLRQDLYYRLNILPIAVPALRDRVEDIEALVKHYYARFASTEGKNIEGIEEDALNFLKGLPWPGNIRQLKNAIFRAIVLCEGTVLTREHFIHLLQEKDHRPNAQAAQAGALVSQPHVMLVNEAGDIRPFVEIEEDILRATIHFYNGHMTKVAEHLAIGRSTLYRKMNEMGIPLKHAH